MIDFKSADRELKQVRRGQSQVFKLMSRRAMIEAI
jgi:hypothetical protein